MKKLLISPVFLNNCQNIFTRNYAFKSDLKIKWLRPVKIPCIRPEKSGDLSPMPKFDKDVPVLNFEQSKELETADENVKKLFSLGFNPNNRTTKFYKFELTDQVKRHVLDGGSMESKLAQMTVRIRNLQDIMEKYPRNGKMIDLLKRLIDKRKKYLKYLRRWDYRRFEWILEKLDLKYVAPPEEYHTVTRKKSLTKLTNIHCENLRNEKLQSYRKQLEKQQITFLTNKLKNLQFIRNEQIECKFPITVTNEQIQEVDKQLKELKVKPTTVTKRLSTSTTYTTPSSPNRAAARN